MRCSGVSSRPPTDRGTASATCRSPYVATACGMTNVYPLFRQNDSLADHVIPQSQLMTCETTRSDWITPYHRCKIGSLFPSPGGDGVVIVMRLDADAADVVSIVDRLRRAG